MSRIHICILFYDRSFLRTRSGRDHVRRVIVIFLDPKASGLRNLTRGTLGLLLLLRNLTRGIVGLLLGPVPSNWHTAASTAGLTRGMGTMGGPRGTMRGKGGGTPEDDWSPPVCGQHTLLTATANGDGGLWILLKILTLMGLSPIAKLACRGQQNKIFKGQ